MNNDHLPSRNDPVEVARRFADWFLVHDGGAVPEDLLASIRSLDIPNEAVAVAMWEQLDPVLAIMDWEKRRAEEAVVWVDNDLRAMQKAGDELRRLIESANDFCVSWDKQVFDEDVVNSYIALFSRDDTPAADCRRDGLEARRLVWHRALPENQAACSALALFVEITCNKFQPSESLCFWMGDAAHALGHSGLWDLLQRRAVVERALVGQPEDCWLLLWAAELSALLGEQEKASLLCSRLLAVMDKQSNGTISALLALMLSFYSGYEVCKLGFDLHAPYDAWDDVQGFGHDNKLSRHAANINMALEGDGARSFWCWFVLRAVKLSKVDRRFLLVLSEAEESVCHAVLMDLRGLDLVSSSLWIAGGLLRDLENQDATLFGVWLHAMSVAEEEGNQFNYVFAAAKCCLHSLAEGEPGEALILALGYNVDNPEAVRLARRVLEALTALAQAGYLIDLKVREAISVTIRTLHFSENDIAEGAADRSSRAIEQLPGPSVRPRAKDDLVRYLGEGVWSVLDEESQNRMVNGMVVYLKVMVDKDGDLHNCSTAFVDWTVVVERCYRKVLGGVRYKGNRKSDSLNIRDIILEIKGPGDGENPEVYGLLRRLIRGGEKNLKELADVLKQLRHHRNAGAHPNRLPNEGEAQALFRKLFQDGWLKTYFALLKSVKSH